MLLSCQNPSQTDNTQSYSAEPQVFVERFKYGVLPYSNYSLAIDTYISENSPDTNNGAGVSFTVGRVTSINRGLLKFNINYIQAGTVTVKKAYLTLISNGGTETAPTLRLYQPVFQFTDNSTWNQLLSYVNNILTPISSAVTIINTIGAASTFEITPSVVQSWIDTYSSVTGIVIKSENETTDYRFSNFCSSENANVSYRPYLTVYYTLK